MLRFWPIVGTLFCVCLTIEATKGVKITRSWNSLESQSSGAKCGLVPKFPYNENSAVRHTNGSNRLAGGYRAKPGEFPSYVKLFIKILETDGLHITSCGGVLLSKDIILTAGHCLLRNVITISAYTGLIEENEMPLVGYESRVQRSEASVYCYHSDFDEQDSDSDDEDAKFKVNDAGIIELRDPFEFTDYVQPVCLARLNSSRPQVYTAVGMGKSDFGDDDNHKLRAAPMKRGCNTDKSPKTHSCFRSGRNQQPRGSMCKGDSGSPIYGWRKKTKYGYRHYSFGIASFILGLDVDSCKGQHKNYNYYYDILKSKSELPKISAMKCNKIVQSA